MKGFLCYLLIRDELPFIKMKFEFQESSTNLFLDVQNRDLLVQIYLSL